MQNVKDLKIEENVEKWIISSLHMLKIIYDVTKEKVIFFIYKNENLFKSKTWKTLKYK